MRDCGEYAGQSDNMEKDQILRQGEIKIRTKFWSEIIEEICHL
jgi:hypothetical protein